MSDIDSAFWEVIVSDLKSSRYDVRQFGFGAIVEVLDRKFLITIDGSALIIKEYSFNGYLSKLFTADINNVGFCPIEWIDNVLSDEMIYGTIPKLPAEM